MARTKVEFKNNQGETLAGLLETPDSTEGAIRYAIFAHCFTCSKDVAAASRISRSLSRKGIAVFRFDFTGLGNSDGDFANTNFSSNVEDLLAAAKMLEDEYQAPSLLIGHSLGGAAVLSAAHHLPKVKAIATIGSPATADHVQHLFMSAVPELEAKGEARVRIGMREFNIKKQLIDDLNQNTSADHIGNLRRPLLIFHSPIDSIVSVDEAAKIYGAAKHPKSFISLDDADHLLSNRDDSEYVGATLAAWAERYIGLSKAVAESSSKQATSDKQTAESKKRPEVNGSEVVVTELDKKFLRGLYTKDHDVISDEPISYGGENLGPSPYNLLLMSIGSCTSMTLRMYANRKKMDLEDIKVRLVYERLEDEERITRYLSFKGDITDVQRDRLVEIADRCPVHRTLENNPVITSELDEV
ncbi:MAG: bifunctional alpha/beta hydrolase/OsmC family protein [Cocleimonas sp.]